jgi:hypothetical protein
LVIAPDVTQSRLQGDYIAGTLQSSPLLSQRIASQTADSITLDNGITIDVRAASFRRLRGLTCVAVTCSEAAFWYSDDSSNPDVEILSAVRPSLLTTGGPLYQITTPYSKKGVTWETYSKSYGKDGDVLVVNGPSRDFNPTLPADQIAESLRDDYAAASAEYLAIFRDDIQAFVSRDTVMACVEPSIRERQPISAIKYFGFCDPSGGSSDSMTLAIGHVEADDRVVIDLVREMVPPFSPESTVEEFAKTLQRYRISSVTGDRYAGEWPREQFRKRGISYETSDLSASDLFRELLPRLNTKSIALLDHPTAIGQLCNLERRSGRGGRDSIDHPRNFKNDLANVIAGVAWVAGTAAAQAGTVDVGFYGDGPIQWLSDRTNGGRLRDRVIWVPLTSAQREQQRRENFLHLERTKQ